MKNVIKYYDERYPDEQRLYNAIGAGEDWVINHMLVSEVREYAFKAYQAAREVKSDLVACAVARSAGQTAATVHVAGHAIHASTYAAKAVEYANDDVKKERVWQYNCLLMLYEKK